MPTAMNAATRTKKPEQTEMVGASAAIMELKEEIERVSHSSGKVLITGESGVGKELVARAIGASSLRASGPFVPVNCAGLPETLLESELFGHVRGSFTGAYRDKPGKLEMASNGTIFLDEIGEMTLRMQGLLLRFLETGEIQTVGADRVTVVNDARVIAATNRDLRNLIAQGQFREDLFYRLNVIHLVVPPLRDRREDIPLLIEHFLPSLIAKNSGAQDNGRNGGSYNGGFGTMVRSIAPDAIAALAEYSWPGNVRQLQNLLEKLVVTGRHEVIQLDDLPLELRKSSSIGARPRRERRRTIADELFKKLVEESESFWTAVYPLYMHREITREHVRDVVDRGLADARGNYKIVLRLFNMEPGDYKRFLNFLRKHDCHLSFKEYRR
jgi:transcriptional regulator with PAS, ATPase and Fis domain